MKNQINQFKLIQKDINRVGGNIMRYCSKCGNTVNENDSFCGKCGNKISTIQNVNQKNGIDFGPNTFNEAAEKEHNLDKVYSDDASKHDKKEKLCAEEDVSKKNQEYNIPWYKKYWKAITAISLVILLAIMINNMLLPKKSWVFIQQDSNKVTYWIDENSINKNKDGWVAFLFKGHDTKFESDTIIELAVDPNQKSDAIYVGSITNNKKDGTLETMVVNEKVIVYLFYSKDRELVEATLNASKKAIALYKEKAGKY